MCSELWNASFENTKECYILDTALKCSALSPVSAFKQSPVAGIVKLQLVMFNYFLIHTVFRCFALDHLVLRRPKSFRKTVVDLENWYYNRLMAEKNKNSHHLKVLDPHNIARLSLCISIESWYVHCGIWLHGLDFLSHVTVLQIWISEPQLSI